MYMLLCASLPSFAGGVLIAVNNNFSSGLFAILTILVLYSLQ